MIPLALVTGFLGSGKTTFLKHTIARYHERRIVYVVNEFSPADVDGHLIAASTEDFVALPGGSIFCSCLVTGFIATMKAIPERFSGPTPLDGVVIEASGVTNPNVVERMLRETRLDRVYRLASIVCIVDPLTFPTLLQTLPNIACQVEASDLLLVNKMDCCDPAQLDAVEATLHRMKPGAVIHRTVRAAIDVDLLGERATQGLEGEYATCADPHFARFVAKPAGEGDLEWIRDILDSARDFLYRAKGFVHAQGKVFHVDWSAGVFNAQWMPGETPRNEIALIVRGEAYRQGRDLVARLQNVARHSQPGDPA